MKRRIMVFVSFFLIPMLLCSCDIKEGVSDIAETSAALEPHQTSAILFENYTTDDEFEMQLLQSIVITVTNTKDGENGSKIGSITVSLPDMVKIYNSHKTEFNGDDAGTIIKTIIQDNIKEFSTEIAFEAEILEEDGQWILADKASLNSVIGNIVDEFIKEVLKDTQVDEITIDIAGEGLEE